MIVALVTLLGAALGVISARRRGGEPLDMAQYGAAYGIVFGLLAFAASLIANAL